MEGRLRNDVLREAASMGGRLLVAREAARSEPDVSRPELDMQDDFEPVTGVAHTESHRRAVASVPGHAA